MFHFSRVPTSKFPLNHLRVALTVIIWGEVTTKKLVPLPQFQGFEGNYRVNINYILAYVYDHERHIALIFRPVGPVVLEL